MESSEVYTIWSINMDTSKVTIYCVVRTRDQAQEAMSRLSDHFIDKKNDQFFCDSTLFFS